MSGRYWMLCEVLDRGQRDKPCLFDENTGMKRGDPPRCIRHGALLFSDSTLNGLSRAEAGRLVRQRHEEKRAAAILRRTTIKAVAS